MLSPLHGGDTNTQTRELRMIKLSAAGGGLLALLFSPIPFLPLEEGRITTITTTTNQENSVPFELRARRCLPPLPFMMMCKLKCNRRTIIVDLCFYTRALTKPAAAIVPCSCSFSSSTPARRDYMDTRAELFSLKMCQNYDCRYKPRSRRRLPLKMQQYITARTHAHKQEIHELAGR